MPRNIEFLPALPISSYSVGRNHDPHNTDTAKSDLSDSILFGTVEYWIGSGGLTLSGSATTGKSSTFTASVSGGVVLSGAAATEYVSGTLTYTYSPSGGVTLSGEAGKTRTFAPPVSGGVVLAGDAGKARTRVFDPAGGVTLAGSAPVALGRTFSTSGGVTLAGAATLAITHAAAVSGGVELAGAATTSYLSAGSTEYPYVASGGIELSGAAATQYAAGQTEQPVVRPDSFDSFSYLVRRESRPIGSAGYRSTYQYLGAAVFGLRGSAGVSFTKSVARSGAGLTIAASAAHSKTKAIRGRAGVRLRKPGSGKTEYLRAAWLVEEEEFLRLIA